jgi:hypothetical protein
MSSAAWSDRAAAVSSEPKSLKRERAVVLGVRSVEVVSVCVSEGAVGEKSTHSSCESPSERLRCGDAMDWTSTLSAGVGNETCRTG